MSALQETTSTTSLKGRSESPTSQSERSASTRRSGRSHFSRTGSFRKHRIKYQLSDSDMSRKGSMMTDTTRTCRIRNFGHYDIQSVSVDRMVFQVPREDSHQGLKKHTGASAANLLSLEAASAQDLDSLAGNDLVAPCPAFKIETGGDWLPKNSPVLQLRDGLSQDKKMRLNSREKVILDGVIYPQEKSTGDKPSNQVFTVQTGLRFPLEYIDHGACYYRHYFYEKDHQNFVGIDESIGPVVLSLRREKVSDEIMHVFSHGQPSNDRVIPKYQYRIIIRTSALPTIRGTILEEGIPGTKGGSNRGVPPREVVEYVTSGELSVSTIKLAKQEEKVSREIMRVDEQELNNHYKIGILYCKAGQSSEEDWYNNENGSGAFDEFLNLIGSRIKMKGFNKYRAQLDNKMDTTGEYSVFTEFENSEIMFHISTLLPFTPNNKQQLLRKRHIGNDIVTLIFQEPGSEPFSPKSIRSHFQHIFIIVRVENPNTENTNYRIAVSRSDDVPYFGPPIPQNGIFQKSEKFRVYLLTKLVNACNAALHSSKLYSMATRTRRQYLMDICKDYSTSISLENLGGGGIGRFFGRKRDRSGIIAPLLFTPGALTWNVSIITRHERPLPFSEEFDYAVDCTLCLAPDVLTFISEDKMAILHIPTVDICGYSQDRNRLNLFYDTCFCLSLEFLEFEEDLQDFTKRLIAMSPAQEAILLEFGRSVISGLLGFTIDQDGTVVKVDGLAKMRGLQRGARVLQVEDKLVCCYTHQEIVELLHDKNRGLVRAYVIPPAARIEKPVLISQSIDWEGVWSLRPQVQLNETSSEISQNEQRSVKGVSPPASDTESLPNGVGFSSRKSHGDLLSNGMGRRTSRPDNLTVPDPYQDDANIYDRLMSYPNKGDKLVPPTSPSNKSTSSSIGPLSPNSVVSAGRTYSRVKVPSQRKVIRQSVLNLANNIMDQRFGDEGENERLIYNPESIGYHLEEYTPQISMQVSQSTSIPNRHHTSSPLSALRKPPTPRALGERDPENLPQSGQVQEMSRKFLKKSGNSPQRSRNSRKNVHVPIVVGNGNQSPAVYNHDPKPSPHRPVNRPLSWDSPHVIDNIPIIESERGDSLPPPSLNNDSEQSSAAFKRHTNIRTPFRQRPPPSPTPSSQETPVPQEDEHEESSRPSLSSQISEDSIKNPTKALDEVLEQYDPEHPKPISVKDRTLLWEMKAHQAQTLPRSFKQRTKSTPCSPLKTPNSAGQDAPRTPTGGNFRHFNFSNSPGDVNSREGSSDYKKWEETTSPKIMGGSPQHKRYPLSNRHPVLPSRHEPNRPHSPSASEGYPYYSDSYNAHGNVPGTRRALEHSYSDSPQTQSEGHFQFEYNDQILETDDQVTWDSINSYCRRVAEWVKQTESAGVLESGAPPSPTVSESLSFATSIPSSDTVDHLRSKVEELEDKLDKESENSRELRNYLKKMEKQINDLQNIHRVRENEATHS